MLVEISTGAQEGVEGLKVELVWENLTTEESFSPGGEGSAVAGCGGTVDSV